MNEAVFLDRDGVLNRTVVRNNKARAPERVEDFEIFPETGIAIRKLHAAGFLTIVVTNQPEIARCNLSWETLEVMHDRLRQVAPINDIIVCPHRDEDACHCRKPKPGMLLDATQKWRIDLHGSFLIGDQWKDIHAGQTAGCRTILIERPYSGDSTPDHRADNLLDAVNYILNTCGEEPQ